MDNQKYKLMVWDTATQGSFKSITRSYYQGCDGIIMVYNVADTETFMNLEMYFEEADKYSTIDNIPIVLVGHRKNQNHPRTVHTAKGQNIADIKGIDFVEVSTYDDSDDQVDTILKLLLRRMVNHPQVSEKIHDYQNGMFCISKMSLEEQSRKRGCC